MRFLHAGGTLLQGAMAAQENKFFVEEEDFLAAVHALAATDGVAEAHEIVQWTGTIVSADVCGSLLQAVGGGALQGALRCAE